MRLFITWNLQNKFNKSHKADNPRITATAFYIESQFEQNYEALFRTKKNRLILNLFKNYFNVSESILVSLKCPCCEIVTNIGKLVKFK